METETDQAILRLSPAQRSIVRSRIHRACASERAGFYCENQVTIQGLDQWGLTHSFVSYLCRRYSHCSEPAAC